MKGLLRNLDTIQASKNKQKAGSTLIQGCYSTYFWGGGKLGKPYLNPEPETLNPKSSVEGSLKKALRFPGLVHALLRNAVRLQFGGAGGSGFRVFRV